MILRIRKHQFFDESGKITGTIGTPVNVTCSLTAPYIATYIAGTVVQTWTDVDNVEGLDTLEFEYKQAENGQKGRDKGTTTSIIITGQQAQDIKDWILSTPCSMLNFWDAQLYDENCDITYQNFELKPDNMEWCLDDEGNEECVVEMPLREIDKKKSALQKVIMTDDWQGWFNGKGGTNNVLLRDFPMIEVVVHNTPIQHGLSIGFPMFILGFGGITIPGVGSISLGGLIGSIFDLDESINKSLGFGNFAPCIPIRDLLQNALGKLNMTLDTNSPFELGNELEYDTIFYPRGGSYHKISNAKCQSPSLKFIWNNRDLTTLEDFINEICKVYSMKWYIVNNVLYFEFNKDSFSLTPIGTITDYEKLCKTFSFEKRKGYGDYRYTVDPADQKSNAVEIAYNDIVDYDGDVSNELLEGKKENRVDFAPTSFWGDGFGEDYLEESTYYGKIVCIVLYVMILFLAIVGSVPYVGLGVVTSPAFIALAAITGAGIVNAFTYTTDIRNRFSYTSCHRGAVEIYGTGELSKARIIRIKDSNPLNEARPIEIDATTIVQNSRYNVNSVDWKDQFNGGYGTKDWAFNFPLYFDANYFGELYNTYHETTDNGLFLSDTNHSRTCIIPLCCDNLTLLGVDDEDNAIGKVVLINGEKILIKSFKINYDTYMIEINGKLIL